MFDSNFIRVMALVIGIGTVVIAIAGTLLYFVFRSFEDPHGSKRRYVLFGGLLAFIFLCCGALYFVRW